MPQTCCFCFDLKEKKDANHLQQSVCGSVKQQKLKEHKQGFPLSAWSSKHTAADDRQTAHWRQCKYSTTSSLARALIMRRLIKFAVVHAATNRQIYLHSWTKVELNSKWKIESEHQVAACTDSPKPIFIARCNIHRQFSGLIQLPHFLVGSVDSLLLAHFHYRPSPCRVSLLWQTFLICSSFSGHWQESTTDTTRPGRRAQ